MLDCCAVQVVESIWCVAQGNSGLQVHQQHGEADQGPATAGPAAARGSVCSTVSGWLMY
jgi:hypothetical protein